MLNALVVESEGGDRVLFDTDKAEAARERAPLLKSKFPDQPSRLSPTFRLLATREFLFLSAECASLVALNIPSFSGGNDVWGPAKTLAVKAQDKVQLEDLKVRLFGFVLQAETSLTNYQSLRSSKILRNVSGAGAAAELA